MSGTGQIIPTHCKIPSSALTQLQKAVFQLNVVHLLFMRVLGEFLISKTLINIFVYLYIYLQIMLFIFLIFY